MARVVNRRALGVDFAEQRLEREIDRIVARCRPRDYGSMPQFVGLALARVAAETPAVERDTWFDMCPGRGAFRLAFATGILGSVIGKARSRDVPPNARNAVIR